MGGQKHTTTEQAIIDFLRARPLITLRRLEEAVGIPERTLSKALLGTGRGVPAKYLEAIENILKAYGYKQAKK